MSASLRVRADFAASAEKQQANAGLGKASDLSDFAVGVAFSVSEPEELALAGLHLTESRIEKNLRIRLRGAIPRGKKILGNLFDEGGARPAPMIAKQVGGDAEEVEAGGRLAFAGKGRSARGTEKTDVAFLHEIFGEGGIGGDTGKIGPERTGGTGVERSEGVVIHGRDRRTVGGANAAGHSNRQCEFPGHRNRCYGSSHGRLPL